MHRLSMQFQGSLVDPFIFVQIRKLRIKAELLKMVLSVGSVDSTSYTKIYGVECNLFGF